MIIKYLINLSAALSIFLSASSALFANTPKETVCVIKPVLEQGIKDTFNELSVKYAEAGNKDVSAFFKNYAEAGHGSGFIFVDSTGENYIITNRHVVVMSRFVNLEFTNAAGKTVTYNQCPVVYADDSSDVAAVKFPDGKKPFKHGLPLNMTNIRDGQEVWSAGYPALMGRPSWQIAKGNVTNNRVSLPEIADTEASWFIQHSASIDPGSSGGPLLISQGPDSYAVTGINTWTMSDRQNTFFAIPARIILKAAADAKKINLLKIKDIDSRLETACREFASAVNAAVKSGKNEAHFVSYVYAAKYGLEDYIELYDSLKKSERDELDKSFLGGVPIEILRYASYEKFRRMLVKKYKDYPLSFVKIEKAPAGEDRTGTALFRIKNKDVAIDWRWENGHWRILESESKVLFMKNEIKKSGSEDYRSKDKSIAVGFGAGIYNWPESGNNPVIYNAGFLSIYDKNNWRYSREFVFEYCGSVRPESEENSGQYGEYELFSLGHLFGWTYMFGSSDTFFRPTLGFKLGLIGSYLSPKQNSRDIYADPFLGFITGKAVLGAEIRPEDSSFALIFELGALAKYDFFGVINTGMVTGADISVYVRRNY